MSKQNNQTKPFLEPTTKQFYTSKRRVSVRTLETKQTLPTPRSRQQTKTPLLQAAPLSGPAEVKDFKSSPVEAKTNFQNNSQAHYYIIVPANQPTNEPHQPTQNSNTKPQTNSSAPLVHIDKLAGLRPKICMVLSLGDRQAQGPYGGLERHKVLVPWLHGTWD